MKNALQLLTIIVLLSSCKKTYNCECTFKNEKTIHELPRQTKKNATKACNEINTTWQDSDGSCTLAK
jgi:hypothetical protein